MSNQKNHIPGKPSDGGGTESGINGDVGAVLRQLGYQSIRFTGEDRWIPLTNVNGCLGTTDDTHVKLPREGEQHARLINPGNGEVRGHARKTAPPSRIREHTETLKSLLDESHLGSREEITIIRRDENRDQRQITYLTNREGLAQTIKHRLPDYEYSSCTIQLAGEMTFYVVAAPSAYFSPSQGLCYKDNQVQNVAEDRF